MPSCTATTPYSHNHSGSSNNTRSVVSHMRYKGLFSPQVAPTTRAYCLLLSFVLGTLMLTAGSVFYHVILSKPMSGSHPMHTPPLPLALSLITGGCLTILACITFAWKYGFDDGDESLDEDLYSLSKDDVLDQQYQAATAATTTTTTATAKDPQYEGLWGGTTSGLQGATQEPRGFIL